MDRHASVVSCRLQVDQDVKTECLKVDKMGLQMEEIVDKLVKLMPLDSDRNLQEACGTGTVINWLTYLSLCEEFLVSFYKYQLTMQQPQDNYNELLKLGLIFVGEMWNMFFQTQKHK